MDPSMLVAIVTPVFNDWTSLSELIVALENVDVPKNIQFSLIVVDDGSSEPVAITCPLHSLHRIREIEIISFGWFHGTFMPQRYFGSFHIHQNEDGADHIERTAAEP